MTRSHQLKRSAVAIFALLGFGIGIGSAAAQVEPAMPRIGLQLWSVTDEVMQDFEGTLSKVAKLGFQGVEFAGNLGPYAGNAIGLKAFMEKIGLACAGAHTNFDALSPAQFDATTSFYKAVGCRNLVISMDKRAFGMAGAAQVAKELTALSVRLAPLGMRIGYHNHAEEMTGADGKTPWDLIATSTPSQTILQQDVGWTTFAGKDPVTMVKRYPGRTVSTHFKPKFVKGTSGTYVIGQDKTDWAGLTKAVRSVGGTEWIIVEQEDYPNGQGQLDSVAASMRGFQAVLARLAAK